MEYTLIREFATARCHVIVDACPDDDLDLSWDDDGSTRKGLDSGEYIAFVARARCFVDGVEVGQHSLGACIYLSLQDFARPGGYFSDMVHEVCQQARENLISMQTLRVRSTQE